MSFFRNVFAGYNGPGKPLTITQKIVIAVTEPITSRVAKSVGDYTQNLVEVAEAHRKERIKEKLSTMFIMLFVIFVIIPLLLYLLN